MATSSVGAHWIRAALQVNPYGYQGSHQPSTSFSCEEDYNRALLDQCKVLGIKLIAITDHWCVDTAAGLIEAATAGGVVALPAFEANSSEGVHLLVMFEAGTELSAVNAAIGACGVDPGCDNGTPGKPFAEILQAMTDRGGLTIPAHVNVPKAGMLARMSGNPLVGMVKDENLHAIAITPNKPSGTDQQQIISAAKPYDRKHPLAVIYSDDVMHPDQLTEEGATSWFKVSNSCLESIKLAVRTPETRVSLTDPTSAPRALLREISWTGGFLDGVTIPIASDLTALIGGRGTGKSTAIESLRYALALDPLGEDATKDHNAIVEKVLGPGAIVRVEVDTVSPTPRSFTIERMVHNPPLVRDESGTATRQQPVDVAGHVEVFGQHELAELASDPALVADMLQRFAGNIGINPEHAEVLARLVENRQKLGKAEDDRATLKGELEDIPRLEEQVKRYEETDVVKRLADLQRLQRDESVFTEASERIAEAQSALAELTDPQLEAGLRAEYDGLEESPQKAILQPAATATTDLAMKLKGLTADALAAIAAAEAEVASAKADWEATVKDQRAGHAGVLRKLQEEGLEPNKYLATANALNALRAKQPRLATFSESLKALQADRTKLIGDLARYEQVQSQVLTDAVRAANAATDGVVVVRPVSAPERQHILDAIGRHISGQRGQITATVTTEHFSPRSFAEAIRKGAGELAKHGITGAQANSLVAAGEPLARELEELSVGQAVEVLLDISDGGSRALKKMDELSKGQRATALLLLLLGASTAPLVIDQPEDDLDNRFVFDGVVKYLRKLKGVRQIIASTHNANVPVLGDAELIVALEGDEHHGRPAPDGIGSLDDAPIRALAERILEGGPEAFNARHHLYGF
jgi:hypothetical protein